MSRFFRAPAARCGNMICERCCSHSVSFARRRRAKFWEFLTILRGKSLVSGCPAPKARDILQDISRIFRGKSSNIHQFCDSGAVAPGGHKSRSKIDTYLIVLQGDFIHERAAGARKNWCLYYLLSKFPYWYAVCASKNDRVETIFQKNNIKTRKSWSDYKITPYFQICLKSDQDLLSRGV